MENEVRVSPATLYRYYPHLEEFFDDEQARRAFLIGDELQLAPQQRIEKIGEEQLKRNLEDLRGADRVSYTVLTACRNSYLHSTGIMRFAELLGHEPPIGSLFVALRKLTSNGYLSEQLGLDISRDKVNFNLVTVPGFITEEGGKKRVVDILSRIKGSSSAVLVPKPISI